MRQPMLKRETKEALIFLLPFFVFLTAFVIYPLATSFYFTLNIIHLADLVPTFTGFGNYVKLASDKLFFQSLVQSLYFLLFHTGIGVALGLFIALLLNEEFHGRTIVRACLLVPWATPYIVDALMFSIIFNPSFGIGTYTFERMGLVPPYYSFFGNPSIALFMLSIVAVWKNAPLLGFIFLSALQNLPVEVSESARVYGVSGFTYFRKIIIPYLKPVIAVGAILSAILSLIASFDIVIGITNGGPGFATYTLYFYSYLVTFPRGAIGYGATLSYITAIIAAGFAFIVLRLLYYRKD